MDETGVFAHTCLGYLPFFKQENSSGCPIFFSCEQGRLSQSTCSYVCPLVEGIGHKAGNSR